MVEAKSTYIGRGVNGAHIFACHAGRRVLSTSIDGTVSYRFRRDRYRIHGCQATRARKHITPLHIAVLIPKITNNPNTYSCAFLTAIPVFTTALQAAEVPITAPAVSFVRGSGVKIPTAVDNFSTKSNTELDISSAVFSSSRPFQLPVSCSW